MTAIHSNKINKIVCLLPIYNEAEVLPSLFDRLNNLISSAPYNIKVLMVDDGSTDGSAAILAKHCINNSNYSVVFLSRNFGHSAAITAGLAHLGNDYDAMFILDADLQDPPELLASFVEKMDDGFEVVYGIRKNRKESFLKKLAYKIYYRLQKKMASTVMPLDAGDFSLLHRKVVTVLCAMPEESRYMRGMRSWVGFNQVGIEYERAERAGGQSKYSWGSLFKLAFNGIFNFSEIPIRFIGRLGIFTIGLSLIYLGILLFKKIFYGSVPEGFTTLITAIVLFSGVQLLCLGILGEYIIRIFFQVKNRPLYVVKSTITKGEASHD